MVFNGETETANTTIAHYKIQYIVGAGRKRSSSGHGGSFQPHILESRDDAITKNRSIFCRYTY